LPVLDSAFGNAPAVTGLVMTAALLGFAASGLLPEGSDPARTLRRALWLIVAASAVCAVAPWFGLLLAGRTAQGIGVGFLVAGGISDVARSHPAAAGGRLTGSLIGGTAIGGLLSRLSGYTAIWLGWRPAFALGGILALILCSIALRRLAAPRTAGGGGPSHLVSDGAWSGRGSGSSS